MAYYLHTLAEHLGCRRDVVSRILRNLGIVKIKHEPLDDLDAQRVIEYYRAKQGRSVMRSQKGMSSDEPGPQSSSGSEG